MICVPLLPASTFSNGKMQGCEFQRDIAMPLMYFFQFNFAFFWLRFIITSTIHQSIIRGLQTFKTQHHEERGASLLPGTALQETHAMHLGHLFRNVSWHLWR